MVTIVYGLTIDYGYHLLEIGHWRFRFLKKVKVLKIELRVHGCPDGVQGKAAESLPATVKCCDFYHLARHPAFC